jgi:hypothetical protein
MRVGMAFDWADANVSHPPVIAFGPPRPSRFSRAVHCVLAPKTTMTMKKGTRNLAKQFLADP